jgi:predicted transcriptional regulator
MVGDLITVQEVARFEGVTERTVLRQLAGKRATTLVAKQGMGPRGRVRKLPFTRYAGPTGG